MTTKPEMKHTPTPLEDHEQLVSQNKALLEAIESAVECDLNIDGTFTAEDIMKTVEKVRGNLRAAIAKAEDTI